MEENMKKLQLQTEISCLQASLESNTSSIGDYKIIKIYEARLLGKEDPYELDDLIAKRNAVRQKINEKQIELATLTGTE